MLNFKTGNEGTEGGAGEGGVGAGDTVSGPPAVPPLLLLLFQPAVLSSDLFAADDDDGAASAGTPSFFGAPPTDSLTLSRALLVPLFLRRATTALPVRNVWTPSF